MAATGTAWTIGASGFGTVALSQSFISSNGLTCLSSNGLSCGSG